MTVPIHIVILDDHQIIIDGLKLLLEKEDNIKVVYEQTNGKALIQHLEATKLKIDVLIMDLMMPVIDGYDMAVLLQDMYPDIKIIILTMNTQADLVYKLVEFTDIRGYLPKTSNKLELLQAITAVHHGDLYFPKEIKKELENYKVKLVEQEQMMLTPREIEIINFIAKGHSTKDIAQALFLSEHTITTHRKNILKKTNTHNAISLLELAVKLNLLN